jgi:predicted transglutaminase-like cysteine proteinase
MKILYLTCLLLLCTSCSSNSALKQSHDLNNLKVVKHNRYNPEKFDVSNLPKFDSIKQVNQFVNNFQYEKDVEDYWKSPKELISSKRGDCEDFAIAKSVLIENSNLSDDNKLVMVRDNFLNVYHVITISDGYVLDNQNKDIITINESMKRYSYLYIIG